MHHAFHAFGAQRPNELVFQVAIAHEVGLEHPGEEPLLAAVAEASHGDTIELGDGRAHIRRTTHRDYCEC